MKLLVFAHTPPPHHGQSYMVQLMLEGFGGDARQPKTEADGVKANCHDIQCYHVNARFSRSLSDVGKFQGAKMLLVFWFCLQAIWIRYRYGVTNFYYVPAPGKKLALYRDWLVMLVCRPFFKKLILHWHAAGLAKWLEMENSIQYRAITWRMFRPVDLSIVLSRFNQGDGQKLLSGKTMVLGNGIPDPCSDFMATMLPRRRARLAARVRLLAGKSLQPSETAAAGGAPQIVKILYLAHCMRKKGLFDAVEAVRLANRQLAKRGSPLQLQLAVAGHFVTSDEQAEFDRLRRDPELTGALRHVGFVSGDRKSALYREADIFCFPTYYPAESFGLVVVEAMAFGLPIVTTRWRSLPELFPMDYPGLVDVQSPDQVASALIQFATSPKDDLPTQLRSRFQDHFVFEQHLANLAAALHSVE